MSDVFTNQEVLVAHANARLNVYGRRLLVSRVIDDGRPVAHVAKELGVSRQCAHRWVARFRAEGDAGLHDRSSRPHRCPRRTPPDMEQRVLELRHTQRHGQDWIGPELGLAPRTVSAILRRHQVPYLRECDPLTGEVIRSSKTTAIRYEHDHPGSLVHMDVKKVGRIPDGGGWRAHGRSEEVRGRGIGYDYVHSLVDDHSRLAYSEILTDEKGTSCAGFLLRAAGLLRRPRHPSHRTRHDRQPPQLQPLTRPGLSRAALNARHVFIRPHCPWQNGKVERFNRTLQIEWAYRQVFLTNDERCAALAPWLEFYNNRRRHSAIGGLPPISRLS